MNAPQQVLSPVPAKGELVGGKWRVGRTIGIGGMGVVLAATDIRLGHKVAIKVLAAESARTPTRMTRFRREARAASTLKSDHVTRVFDVGTLDDGGAYLVMEYLEGENLRKLLRKRCLPIVTCVDLMLQVIEAIAEAHQRGIVHRDVKPANLFVTRRADGSPWIKVLDFGLSKITDDAMAITHTSALLGSPMYMSPEQLSSSKSADARSDIWSLGVVLFEMLSQETPFGGETLYEVVGATLYDEPRRLRDVMLDVPDGLDEALARCLAKDPRQRFQSVAELATAIAPFGGPNAEMSAEYIRQVSRGTTRVFDVAKLANGAGNCIYPPIADDEAETLVAPSPLPVPPQPPPSMSIPPVSLTPRAVPIRRPYAFARWVTMAAILCLTAGGLAATLVVRAPVPAQVGAMGSLSLDLEVVPVEVEPAAPAEHATLKRATPPSDARPPARDGQFLRRPVAPQLLSRF